MLEMRRAYALAALLAACAPPARNSPPVVDLRVCVESEETALVYRRYFKAAAAGEPGGGRLCDVAIKSSTMDAGKVTARSAYDGSVLAEITGTLDLAPRLVKIALEPGTAAHRRVAAQRAAAGFAH